AEMALTRFAPIATAQPWESAGPRRAGVNAFGFGGINDPVIIDAYVPTGAGPFPIVTEPDLVLWLSATDPAALSRLLDQDDGTVRELGVAQPGIGQPGAPQSPARLGVVDPTAQRIAAARRIVARGEPWRGGRDIWFTPRPLLGPSG